MCVSETPDAPLTITLFGPMRVLVNGQPLPHGRSRKTLWLLALLTLRHGRSVEREWLAGMLWPNLEQSRAYANLRPILSDLRDRLGSERGRLQTPNRLTMLLDITGADIDVLAFDVAVKRKQLSALEQAVKLYRGPLLEGCLEEWVFQERTAREQNCLQALQMLAEAAFSGGDYISAISYYKQAINLDPLADIPRRGLMETLSKSGDRNAALQVYREFVDVIRSDPRSVPDEMTCDLYARLRAEVHVKSGAHAVVTSQKSRESVLAGYLPHPLTNLIGREDETIEVTIRLRRSRLVTLTGPGGIGKTRLALAVAADVVKNYPDGVWLVALEALTDGQLVLAQIASTLKIKDAPGFSLKERVTDHLRTKRLLLVLDNCEHVLEATTRAAANLLQECPQVRILATSREALGITGETVWVVPALATPDLQHLPQGRATLLRVLMSYESVQLFMERTQAVQKSFALTGENAMAVAQVCSRLEGIPLAIELAAARVKAMAVEQITVRLKDHLSLLTGGNRTAMSRQQTLRATLDWSYELLSNPERLLLARVSVFAGGWTLAAAEGVCSGEPIQAARVLDLLTSLADKSLVVFEERGRYRLLETVRQYAVQHLQTSGAAEQVQSRQRHWCVALAEEAEAHLRGADQETWMNWLDTEYANLRAALTWSGTDVREAQVRLRLAGALWRYWNVRGYIGEGRHFLEVALTGVEAPTATQARARALYGAGALAQNQSDYVSAQRLLEESLCICRQLGDKSGIALATSFLGNIARNQGDLAAAKTLFEASLSLYRDLGDKCGIATMLIKLGEMAVNQGEPAAARTQFEESLLLYREMGNKIGIADALFVLGHAATIQGDYVTARTQLEESLFLRRELGNKIGIADALNNLAKVAALQDDFEAARTQFEESLLLHRDMGGKLGIAVATGNLGTAIANHQGDYVSARTQLEEGLRLCRELGDKQGIAYALVYLGRTFSSQGDYATARTQLEEGLRLCRELGDKRGIAMSLENIAVALSAETESAQVARLLGAAQSLRKSIRSPLPSGEQERVDRQIAQVRKVLGTAVLAKFWEEGSAMTLEQAVGHALKE